MLNNPSQANGCQYGVIPLGGTTIENKEYFEFLVFGGIGGHEVMSRSCIFRTNIGNLEDSKFEILQKTNSLKEDKSEWISASTFVKKNMAISLHRAENICQAEKKTNYEDVKATRLRRVLWTDDGDTIKNLHFEFSDGHMYPVVEEEEGDLSEFTFDREVGEVEVAITQDGIYKMTIKDRSDFVMWQWQG